MAGLTLDSLYSLFSLQKDQWAMSSAENVEGMSLPEIHSETNMTPLPANIFADDSSISTGSYDSYLSGMTTPTKSGTATPQDTTNALLADYLGGMKSKAAKQEFTGAVLKSVASAGSVFNSIMSLSMGRRNANRQYSNAKLSAENKMAALDNQVMYYKNQIEDKFNTTLAKNTAVMAAKNLRVSTGALLEQMKDAAYDATKDIETMESNAELKKIALRNEVKQAKITKELTKSQLTTNLIGSLANLGLTVASGGGTMESWGDLYSGFKEAQDFDSIKKAMQSGSLSDLY